MKGLEPSTFCMASRRSSQLSYIRVRPEYSDRSRVARRATGLTGELRLAEAAPAAADLPPAIVRRYQFDPTPLVGDTPRGYRTGHVERVLAGDFDVY